jgi:hypothetical protein
MKYCFMPRLIIIAMLVTQGIYAQGAKHLPTKSGTSQETTRDQWLY